MDERQSNHGFWDAPAWFTDAVYYEQHGRRQHRRPVRALQEHEVAPVAGAQSVSTNEDTAKTITLTGSDADGNNLTFAVVSGPSNGTLGSIGSVSCTGTAPKTCSADLTYTPALNYNGSDSFTFKVNDGTVDSANATVSITVNAVNDVPVANTQSVSTNEDTAKTITLTGSDLDETT